MMHATAENAGWLPYNAHWWPIPRRVEMRDINAIWEISQCRRCRRHRAVLQACQLIQKGEEIRVWGNPTAEFENVLIPLEATMDGSSYPEDYGGAGATVWAQGTMDGPPQCVARAHLAIPYETDSQAAEAMGCRLSLAVINILDYKRRTARIVGDNPSVVRFGANTAKLKKSHVHMQLEDAISLTLMKGWKHTGMRSALA